MAYIERAINLTIEIGKGSFGDSGFNTITLTGLRVEAQIEATIGGAGQPPHAITAAVRVYGLPLSLVNELSNAGLQYVARNNVLTIAAGDARSGMTAVFKGNILDAFPDYGNPPEVSFLITSRTGQFLSLTPVSPVTYPGAVNAADVMGTLATNAGLTLENNGISVLLQSPYFPGTTAEQIRRCAEAARCYAVIDGASDTLAIWPKGGARKGAIPMISAATGMIGYPAVQRVSGTFRTLFNPQIIIGRQVRVQSQLTAANGLWNLFKLDYDIASQLPGGPWEMSLYATSQNAPS